MRRRNMMILSVLFLLVGSQLFNPPISVSQTFVIKHADATPTTFAYWKAAEAMKAEVEKKTNNIVKFDLYGGGILTKDQKALLEMVRMGSVQMGVLAASLTQSLVPEHSVLNLPFLWKDIDNFFRFLDSNDARKLGDLLEDKGIKFLTFVDGGVSGIQNRLRPIINPEDLKGLKIRVMQDPILVDSMEAMGALPVAMGLGELYSAIQQGVIDGISTAPQFLNSIKTQEVAKYYTHLMPHITTSVLLMNLKFWQGLPKNLQQVIMESANTTFRNGVNNYFVDPKLTTSDTGILKIWEGQGVKISQGNQEAFREKTRPVVAKWREKIGKDLVDNVLKYGGYK